MKELDLGMAWGLINKGVKEGHWEKSDFEGLSDKTLIAFVKQWRIEDKKWEKYI